MSRDGIGALQESLLRGSQLLENAVECWHEDWVWPGDLRAPLGWILRHQVLSTVGTKMGAQSSQSGNRASGEAGWLGLRNTDPAAGHHPGGYIRAYIGAGTVALI